MQIVQNEKTRKGTGYKKTKAWRSHKRGKAAVVRAPGSGFYSPMDFLAGEIYDALSLENSHKYRIGPTNIIGEMGAGVRTRGEILKKDDNSVFVRVYALRVWLRSCEVFDFGDGTIKILHSAFNRCPRLRFSRNIAKAARRKILAKRNHKSAPGLITG